LGGSRDFKRMAQQPVRVVVEKRPSGCGTWLAIMVLLGLAIAYWYVSLATVAIVIAVAIIRARQKRELARHRPGPRDPWLNEVAVAVADLGFTETERNTGSQLGGAPIEGDIGLQANRLKVYVNLCSDQRLARQADLGLRARPDIRAAISKGATAIHTAGRVVYVAKGRGGVVDELGFEEVVRVVGELAVPPPLMPGAVITTLETTQPADRGTWPAATRPEVAPADVLEQLRKLGELRDAGVLTDAEFAAKKAELLGRV
jgi:Short C-terminal domain